MAQSDLHTVKTYMSFTYPVDPARVKTLVDLDLSYALATALVDWNDSRNLTGGLAQPVESSNDKELILKLKSEAKWSDGTQITASQVISSIEHARQLHDESMQGLFEMVTKIEPKDEKTLLFHLNRSVAQSQILFKLTEPFFGIVFIKDGKTDLTKTSGPFTLKSSTTQELVLKVNTHWYAYQQGMPDSVVIRQPKATTLGDQDGFANDPWANIMTSSSLMPEKSLSGLTEKNYSVWNRNLDRVFFLSPSSRLANEDGRKLMQAFSAQLDRKILLNGLSGYHLSEQFFPPGYPIFDPEFVKKSADVKIPQKFKTRPLELLAPEGRVGVALQKNIRESLKAVTGLDPKITLVPLSEFEAHRIAGKFDIAVVTIAVNDPNAEGPVSFVFGLKTPLIQNSEGEMGDFKARVIKSRALDEKARNSEYRKIFSQATNDGCILPLFHFSSIAIAREGIDLSKVPTTDETVAFSKVRFK